MWKLDHKVSRMLKNGCFWIVLLEKTLESPLDCNEIIPINPKVNQPWIFIGRTDAKAEAPKLWPLIGTANSLEKTLVMEKTEGKRRRGWQRMRWLYSISNSMDMSLSKLPKTVKDRKACHAAVHGITRSQTRLSDWTTKKQQIVICELPSGTSGKESAWQCRRYKRCAFESWVRKIPWRRAWQPTLVFLPGK